MVLKILPATKETYCTACESSSDRAAIDLRAPVNRLALVVRCFAMHLGHIAPQNLALARPRLSSILRFFHRVIHRSSGTSSFNGKDPRNAHIDPDLPG